MYPHFYMNELTLIVIQDKSQFQTLPLTLIFEAARIHNFTLGMNQVTV